MVMMKRYGVLTFALALGLMGMALAQEGQLLGEMPLPSAQDNAPKEQIIVRGLPQDLAQKLTAHPRLDEARLAVCTANFQIAIDRSNYFPKVDVSLSGGNKFVNETTRADEYGGTDSPEYDGKGLNFTIALRQQLYDWGETRQGINIAQTQRSRALLERMGVLNEQTANVMRNALEFASQDAIVVFVEERLVSLEKTITSVEARFEAGAGRISEMREAQLIRLEQQASLDLAKKRRAQAADSLKTQFDINPAQALQFVKIFSASRPAFPESILAETSLRGRVIALDMRSARHEEKRLQAQRLPKIEGVDYDDARSRPGTTTRSRYTNCHSHEVTGNLEFNLPLFDGGVNEAQRGEVEARLRGLDAGRLAHIRDHEADSQRAQARLREYQSRLTDQEAQSEKMRGQLDSLLAIEGKTQSNPIAIGRLQARLIESQAQELLLNFQLESIRLEILLLADALASTMGIELADTGC